MRTSEYEAAIVACATASSGHIPTSFFVLGLNEEAGEVAGKLKKMLRGDRCVDETRELMLDELGDTLWYLQATAKSLGANLEVVMRRNLAKVQDRHRRGVVRGDGDAR